MHLIGSYSQAIEGQEHLLLYYSMLPWNNRNKISNCGKNTSDTLSCALSATFLFLTL